VQATSAFGRLSVAAQIAESLPPAQPHESPERVARVKPAAVQHVKQTSKDSVD
jgi:hypothetical protein